MMTDDEINRRVAEIEGWVKDGNGWTLPRDRHIAYVPSYATDWEWCGPLVEKYRIWLESRSNWWCALNYGDGWYTADTPQRAICLAVIAANPRADDGPSGPA